MHIDFIVFLLKQKKLNDTLLPLYIFLKLMPCSWIWKQKVSLIWATDFNPALLCFSIKTFSTFVPDCFACYHAHKRTTAQFVIWDAINIFPWWEIWWEVDWCLELCKQWQNPQLFLLQATYWKRQTSQSSLRLNDLRTIPKFSKNHGFQT